MNHPNRIESLKLELAAALDASYAARESRRLADALTIRALTIRALTIRVPASLARRCVCGAPSEVCVKECAGCLVKAAKRGYW